MEPSSSALEEFFQVWEKVKDVSSLSFGECKSALEFFGDGTQSGDLFKTREPCIKFTERFGQNENDIFPIVFLIRNKITEVQTRMQQLVLPIDFKSVWLKLDEATKTSFNQYSNLGNSSDYAHYEALLNKIYTEHIKLPPSIFVCAPSGTGKTQLAFSLAKNRLYFLIKPESAISQHVYEPFELISEKLYEFIADDIARLKKIRHLSAIKNKKFATSKYINDKSQSFAATFIVFLIKQYLGMSSLNWLELEAQIGFENIKEEIKTLEQLRDELVSLFPKHSDRPVVFFDECFGSLDNGHIYYMRAVLRSIGLISISMGSDATAVSNMKNSKYFPNGGGPELYAVIINRLPQMCDEKFNKMRVQLVELIMGSNILASLKTEKVEVLNLVFEMLHKERPLFIMYVFEYLKVYFCNNPNVFIDIKDLCESIRKEYVFAKMIDDEETIFDYTKSQINLIMNEKWRLHEMTKYWTVAIKRHIAYLNTPTNLFRNIHDIPDDCNYFPLCGSGNRILEYTMQDKAGELKYETFRPISIMPSFNVEPIACLVFSGSMDGVNTFIKMDGGNLFQISAFEALYRYIRKAMSPSASSLLSGEKLKFLCAMAAVASSRASNGCFFKFLERFAFHFSFYSVERTLDNSELSDEWKQRLQVEEFTVPLLASVSSTWNEYMKKLLIIYYSKKFRFSEDVCKRLSGGICEPYPYESYGIDIHDGKGNHVIKMECKPQRKPLSIKECIEIFDQLSSTGCQIGFVVASRFSKAWNKTEKLREESIPSNYSVYSLISVEYYSRKLKKLFPVDEEHTIKMPSSKAKKMKIGRSPDEKPYLFILISLKDLYTPGTTLAKFLADVPN